ncbi:DUF2911 domain-containing protein [uncultured Winogradskyella sp.]|uniref:DUF2911 domain-containing protein n=1 Tax=uncultured Winogradskyella sp. TaxID=395353 RepID=UPI002612740F|nr:DUF2911 domain-containing protein [uncultured Winogradskyella sp.]|tara:strand:+ start:1458 stop:2303 length:846 start_codon:yes stop_codon:yes gene_type:complete
MKKLVLFTFALTLMFSVNAQIETPQPSPAAKLEQVVGLTDVAIEYSRPAMNGRTIFGDLVPYGKLWRAGANKNTMVTFSDAVVIGGKDLKAGAYAIFVTPSEKSWEVIFYNDTNNWGTPKEIDESKVAVRVTAEVYPIEMDIQSFTISVDDITTNSAVIGMMWEKTYVGVKFEVPTDKTVTAAIEKTMAGPSANDYYAAAVYNLAEGKDIKQAKEWIDKAISMMDNPRFYHLRKQSLIYAKAGDKKGAIAIAKKSLEDAKKSENADYVKMNEDSLKEWGAK